MTADRDTCVYCERFKATLRSDLPPGHGWCTAWEEPKPWNGQIGVLFKEAKDRAPRARYVAMQGQQQKLEKA